jgi:hypothetical protein
MQSCGWLAIGEDGIRVPNYDRHNGESAKKREQKNQRQSRWRDGKASTVASTVASTPASTTASTTASTREDKIREDKKRGDKEKEEGGPPSFSSSLVQLAGPLILQRSPAFDHLESEWQRVCGNAGWTTLLTAKAWNDAITAGADPEAIANGLENSALVATAEEAQYVGKSHNYIINGCWLDQVEPEPEQTTPEYDKAGWYE